MKPRNLYDKHHLWAYPHRHYWRLSIFIKHKASISMRLGCLLEYTASNWQMMYQSQSICKIKTIWRRMVCFDRIDIAYHCWHRKACIIALKVHVNAIPAIMLMKCATPASDTSLVQQQFRKCTSMLEQPFRRKKGYCIYLIDNVAFAFDSQHDQYNYQSILSTYHSLRVTCWLCSAGCFLLQQ